MAYTRTNWVSGETPLSATNMNNIEDGIEECQDGISDLNSNLNNLLIRRIYTNQQIIWSSTSNPYQQWEKNVAVDGYTPIDFNYAPQGTGSTTIYAFNKAIANNTISIGLRNENPVSSVTQNTMNVTVTYIRSDYIS